MVTKKTAQPDPDDFDPKKPDPDDLGPVNMGPGETGSPMLGIPKIRAERILIPIRSTTPLICHNWSEKARRQIRDKKMNRKVIREAVNPEAEYEASMYRISKEDGTLSHGMPVGAFAKCTVGAARFYGKDVTMTGLRQFLVFGGIITDADAQPLVEIHGTPKMREDHVRLTGGSADLTYRAEFPEWTATLEVKYVVTSIDAESVLSLVDAGGQYVGIGDWRPEKGGLYGTFEIDDTRDTQFIR
jgi:hypothetical protein